VGQPATADETGLATRRGFVTSARQGWINTNGTQSEVFLIQFGAPAGARSMDLDLTGNWKVNQPDGRPFTDSAVPASGIVINKLDSLGNAEVRLAAVRGDILVYIRYYSAATPDKAGAESLLHRQIKTLG
jgi:hypothetical protein